MIPAKKLVRVTLASCLLFSAACSKKDDTAENSTGSGRASLSSAPVAVNAADPLGLGKTLATAVPDSTLALFYWNMSSPAYTKFQASPWARKDAWNFSAENLEGLEEVLSAAGVDMKKGLADTFSESVVFALPAAAGAPVKTPQVGALASAKSEQALNEKVTALKAALSKRGIAVSEKAIEGTKTIRFNPSPLIQAAEPSPGEPPQPAPTSPDLIIGWSGNTAILATEESVIAAVATKSKARAIPPALIAPEVAQLSAGIPQDRFGIGYAAVEQLIKSMDSPEAAKVPVTTALVGFSMNETPETIVRVGIRPRNDREKTLLSALGTTTPAAFLSAAPSQPLVFLSLDAKAVRAVRELAEEPTPGAPPQMDSQLAMLNSIDRIAVAARLAPAGQSMLPLPDLLIIAESKDAQKLLGDFTGMVGGMMGVGAAPGMSWKDKQVEGVTVKTLSSGMGVSINAAVQGSTIIASSSDAIMADVLAKLKKSGGGMQDTLSATSKSVLGEEKNVGSVLIDFDQLGSFLEGVGGMLSMYAPPNSAGNKLTSPEVLAEIKKMGTLIGSLKISQEIIELRSFYEQKKGA